LSRLQEEIRAPPPPPKPEALRCAVSDKDDDPIETLVFPVGAGGRGRAVLGDEAKEGWELEEGSVAEPE
jgi:ATP-dependent RNA helicase DDX42